MTRAPRDSAATKARLMAAATSEFAAYGIAGARVDRIAAAAGANKQLIYAYFGDKDGLFTAVMEEAGADLLETIPITADDLPGYAVALHDYARAHPVLGRLATWAGLERPEQLRSHPVVLDSMRHKVAAIADAQSRGAVSDAVPPDQLLSLVMALSGAWDDAAHGSFEPVEADDEARRAAIRHAVSRVVQP